jgi:peptide chain release factor 3
VGILQFDVVAERLRVEYNVDCMFEAVNVQTARWIQCNDDAMLQRFKQRAQSNLALDHAGELVYIAPTRVNLQLIQDKWPKIEFLSTREHGLYD